MDDPSQIVRTAIDLGDLSRQDPDGRNALMLAVQSHPIEDIRKVLAAATAHNLRTKGPPFVFETDATGRTALFYAVERGDAEIVWLLLNQTTGTGLGNQRGALLSRKDDEGKSAEDLATTLGRKEIADILSKERVRIEYFE